MRPRRPRRPLLLEHLPTATRLSVRSRQACCTGGRFSDAGTICRQSANECDVPDTCSGTTSTCTNLVMPPGTSCGDAGTCGLFNCAPSRDQLCRNASGGNLGFVGQCLSPVSTACNQLACRQSSGFCATFTSERLPDGATCGAGNQCLDGTCVPSDTLFLWDWDVSAFGACTNGLQTRTVTCIGSTGATGMDSKCPAPKPITVQNCP